MQLDLLRHGQTQAGSGFFGSTDTPLSEAGWRQMWDQVAEHEWDVIVSSPLLRCRAFAERLRQQRELPLQLEPAFQELHFGDWEGQTAAQVYEHSPELLAAFWQDPYALTPAHAESMQHFSDRVLSALQRLQCSYAGQRVLLISHAGVMRLLLARAQGLPAAQLLQVPVDYASLHRLITEPLSEGA